LLIDRTAGSATGRLHSGHDELLLCAVVSRCDLRQRVSHADHEDINDAIELAMRRFRTNISGDESGTTAVEFAIVGPIFIFLVIGIAFLCMALAVAGSMHYAVEEGARCASVRKTICSSEDTTIAYIKAHYFGPGGVPTFAYDPAAACGHSVTASINYVVDMGLKKVSVPITAAACFP